MNSSPIDSEYNMFNMPRGVTTVLLIRLFSAISFGVMYATLVLYMKQKIGLSVHMSDSITGVFFAYNFALHLLAGFMSGRYFSYRSFVVIGSIFQLIAGLVLSMQTTSMLYLGLAFMLVGSGTMTTCINMLISQLFSPNDSRRETVFLWSYSVLNAGFFLGDLLAGYFQLELNYHVLYVLTGVSNIIPVVIMLFNWSCLHDRGTAVAKSRLGELRKRYAMGWVITIALLPILYVLLQYPNISGSVVLLIGVFIVFYILYMAFKYHGSARNKILVFLFLLVAAQIFYIISMLAPMGLTLFAHYNVERHVFGFLISQGWIQGINNITLIVCGPLLALIFKLWRKKSKNDALSVKYGIGLLLIASGILVLPIGITFASSAGYVDFSWLFSSYVLLAVAELFIAPVGYAMVGLLIPAELQSVMMGVVLFNAGVGAVLSGRFSSSALGASEHLDPLLSNAGYSHVFNELGLAALVFAVLVFVLAPFMQKMMRPS